MYARPIQVGRTRHDTTYARTDIAWAALAGLYYLTGRHADATNDPNNEEVPPFATLWASAPWR